jgi:hypothetical protein
MPRRPPPPPDPRDVRFVARLDLPPFDPPRLARADPIYERRVEADRLCMWMACRRKLCRESRCCNGTLATCIFENPDIVDPILR